MFYPGSLIRTFFHPGSFIKRGIKNKSFLFLAIYGYQEQVSVVLTDIRAIEILRIMKKMKDYLTQKCAGSGIRDPEKFHPGSRR
jgi:hypothetical protein